VNAAIAGGAGAEAGIQSGDVIQTLDGAPAGKTEDFVKAIAKHYGGDKVTVGVLRGGQSIVKEVTLKPRPLEKSPYADVLYETLNVSGSLRRAIVTRPKKAGRFPAVLLMQGLGCYSIDNIDRKTDYGRVFDEFEQKGFVTMRVEKTGQGDSEGPPCEDPR